MTAIPESLREFFRENRRLALAFSGGADSSYLLYAALECKADVTAYFVKTQLQPERELENARRTASELGADIHILLADALTEEVSQNGKDRCYYCKLNIFRTIQRQADMDNIRTIVDATNASDSRDERPGMKALDKLGIVSPLHLCGITKPQIREYSKNAGLWTWDLPSNSCLATRIGTGEPITPEKLLSIEKAEEEIRRFGFTQFRVRTTGCDARLETLESERDILDSNKSDIENTLKKYYTTVDYGNRKPSL